MKAIYIRKHGEIDDAAAVDVPVPVAKDGEVLVKIGASGINPSDIASIQGKFPGSGLLGAVVWGGGGDLGISRDGTHAEYLALPASAVARRPANLSADEAATVGIPYVTAFQALFRLGNLQAGECVIVSGAAGSVGQAAIQLARAKGAYIVALVKDEKEGASLQGVQAIARSDRADLETVVREATAGKGASLALNGVGGSIFQPLLGALAAGGKQVVYSAGGGREASVDLLSFYQHRITLIGLNTRDLDATACAAILTEIGPLFESAVVKPLVVSGRYELSDAATAYRHVASGGNGKSVFVMGT
jgi:NADPH2:quinone reductase